MMNLWRNMVLNYYKNPWAKAQGKTKTQGNELLRPPGLG